MQNGEDDSEEKPTRSQDLVETVAPPRGKRPIALGGALRGVVEGDADAARERAADVDSDGPASVDDEVCQQPLSPDEIPTERPPWTDPVESRERLIDGVQAPPVKKNA